MELFAASVGSSILNVFGIKTHLSVLLLFSFSALTGLRISPSLECFPSAEVEWFVAEDGDEKHGTVQEPGKADPQNGGGGG